MTGAEFMQCLKVEYDYCQPATLNRLSECGCSPACSKASCPRGLAWRLRGWGGIVVPLGRLVSLPEQEGTSSRLHAPTHHHAPRQLYPLCRGGGGVLDRKGHDPAQPCQAAH